MKPAIQASCCSVQVTFGVTDLQQLADAYAALLATQNLTKIFGSDPSFQVMQPTVPSINYHTVSDVHFCEWPCPCLGRVHDEALSKDKGPLATSQTCVVIACWDAVRCMVLELAAPWILLHACCRRESFYMTMG